MAVRFESMDEFLKYHHSNETTEQYVLVLLFIMLYKMVLALASVYETLKCDHSNEICNIRQCFPENCILCCTKMIPTDSHFMIEERKYKYYQKHNDKQIRFT